MPFLDSIFRTLCGRELTQEEKKLRLILAIRGHIESGSYKMVERLLTTTNINVNEKVPLVTEYGMNPITSIYDHHTYFLHIAIVKALNNWQTRLKYIYIII